MLPAHCSAEEELLLGSGVRVHVSAGQVGAAGEPAVVTGWRAQERLLLQVENAGHSSPQARSTSANTLTMLFGLGFFCTAFFFPFLFVGFFFFFLPSFSSRSAETSAHRHPKHIILTTQAREKSYFLFFRWQNRGSGMAGFAQQHGKSWEAGLHSRLHKFDSRSFAERRAAAVQHEDA